MIGTFVWIAEHLFQHQVHGRCCWLMVGCNTYYMYVVGALNIPSV